MKTNLETPLGATALKSSEQLTDAQINFAKDEGRVRTRRAALLELLLDGEWHPNYECSRVGGLSFHCSLYELRKEGWRIESRHARGGVWEYRLVGRQEETVTDSLSLSRPQRRVAEGLLIAVRKAYGSTGLDRVREHMELVSPKH